MNYNVFNAIVYDVLWRFCDSYPSLRGNKFVQMAMEHCFPDWVLWKTELTMEDAEDIKPKPELEEPEIDLVCEKCGKEYTSEYFFNKHIASCDADGRHDDKSVD